MKLPSSMISLGRALKLKDPRCRIILAERFEGAPRLARLILSIEQFNLKQYRRLDAVIVCPALKDWRRISIPATSLFKWSRDFHVTVPRFENAGAALFQIILAAEADNVSTVDLISEAEQGGLSRRELTMLRSTAFGRPRRIADSSEPTSTRSFETARKFEFAVERNWVSRNGMFLEGWMHAYGSRIRSVSFDAGRGLQTVQALSDRSDIAAQFPKWPLALHSGFRLYLPWQPGRPLAMQIETDDGSIEREIELPPGDDPPQPGPLLDPFAFFVHEINDRRLAAVEIGARKVSTGWVDFRQILSNCSSFIGIDIHDGPGVDLVGDAHFLHKLVGERSADAIFSHSVLEHLARPWLMALNVNRSLRVGGLTFHTTHQTWPLHEEPNDFWRFSAEALTVLFGPETGFEVVAAAMRDPFSVCPLDATESQWLLPFAPAFGQSYVLARKVREVESSEFRDALDRAMERAQT